MRITLDKNVSIYLELHLVTRRLPSFIFVETICIASGLVPKLVFSLPSFSTESLTSYANLPRIHFFFALHLIFFSSCLPCVWFVLELYFPVVFPHAPAILIVGLFSSCVILCSPNSLFSFSTDYSLFYLHKSPSQYLAFPYFQYILIFS